MITGLVIIGLFFAVLALGARLHEANVQLAERQRELESVAHHSFEVLLLASVMADRMNRRPEQ